MVQISIIYLLVLRRVSTEKTEKEDEKTGGTGVRVKVWPDI